jgi:hypothetical protein
MKYTYVLRRRMRALVLALAGSAIVSGASAGTFVDGFDDNRIDPTWWSGGSTGSSTIVATGQRLVLEQGADGFAGLAFKLPISGDFVARIDYELLAWPDDNRERLALGAVAGPNQLLIERVSDRTVGVGTEIYVTDFTGQGILGTPTTDRAGTLQLQREGDTVRGSFLAASGWQVIGTYQVAGEGAVARSIGFAIFPGAPTTAGVRVALDNFRLQGPAVPVPEPAGALLFAVGLGGLLVRSRWRARRRLP